MKPLTVILVVLALVMPAAAETLPRCHKRPSEFHIPPPPPGAILDSPIQPGDNSVETAMWDCFQTLMACHDAECRQVGLKVCMASKSWDCD
jgi:hypothetical protein